MTSGKELVKTVVHISKKVSGFEAEVFVLFTLESP